MSNDDPKHQQRLVDALQVAAMTAQRLAVTSRQQQEDANRCVDALERAIAEVRPDGTKERQS